MDFLSEKGLLIYDRLEKHCQAKLKMFDIDSLELAMLANSFAMYSDAAIICRDSGVSFTITTEKGGEYEQIRPEYTVMKNEYQNILKHGAKFGLNPGDRDKIFKGLKDDKKKKGFDLQ
jgi:phage terminase small subunit